MREMSIPPGALRRILEQMRALQVETDDEIGNGERDDDLRQAELRSEIEDLNRDQQHELVALMWIGRGDFGEADWDEVKTLAEERHDTPTFQYLMGHPQAADEIAAGLEEIGHDHLLQDGEY